LLISREKNPTGAPPLSAACRAKSRARDDFPTEGRAAKITRSDFWNPDNSHPNLTGSYLAACVLYAVIFQDSPEGIGDHLNLGKTKAGYLQKIAAETVLNDLKRWHIK